MWPRPCGSWPAAPPGAQERRAGVDGHHQVELLGRRFQQRLPDRAPALFTSTSIRPKRSRCGRPSPRSAARRGHRLARAAPRRRVPRPRRPRCGSSRATSRWTRCSWRRSTTAKPRGPGQGDGPADAAARAGDDGDFPLGGHFASLFKVNVPFFQRFTLLPATRQGPLARRRAPLRPRACGARTLRP